MSALIQLQQVSLYYRAKNLQEQSLKKKLIRFFLKDHNKKSKTTSVKAIHNLNLTLKSGDRIGIVGANGAGKSSLFKLISGIYPPSQGTVTTRGKIHAIMNVSLGLNDHLSGYENIIYKGILLGLSLKNIKSKMDDIITFAELEDRIHNQISTYSTGMRVRLALGILLAVESDILLVDEMIGALDLHFIHKYRERLIARMGENTITIVISHSFDIINNFCNQVIWLDSGNIKQMGDPHKVITAFTDNQINSGHNI